MFQFFKDKYTSALFVLYGHQLACVAEQNEKCQYTRFIYKERHFEK